MRDITIPESGPKRKILDATEALVVAKGFDLVSTREITSAAKVNIAAINYHFGSREGLMRLIPLHVLVPVDTARLKALGSLGKSARLRDFLSAYVTPLLETAASHPAGTTFFLNLTGRVLLLPASRLHPPLQAEHNAVSQNFFTRLASSVPKNHHPELLTRWNFFEAGLAQSLVALTSEPAAAAQQWIETAASGLPGPEPLPLLHPSQTESQPSLFEMH